MAEILVGHNYPISHKVFWAGEPRDADSLPVVKIYHIDADVVQEQPSYIMTSTKSEHDIGVYKAVLPFSLISQPQDYKAVWVYNVDAMPVIKTHRLYVVQPYTDIEQAIEYLGFGSDPSDPEYKTYKDIQDAERFARKTVEAYTGQNFYLYDAEHAIYGAGTDVLPTPYKLNNLKRLYENDILLVDNENEINNIGYDIQISESKFGIRVNRSEMIDNTVYTANGMVPPTINSYSNGFFNNGSVYRVVGTYGYEFPPDEVELATIELMKDYFSKDKAWRNKYVHSVQSFDWHFEYNNESYRGTGNVYVDQLLLPYVLTQMVVI